MSDGSRIGGSSPGSFPASPASEDSEPESTPSVDASPATELMTNRAMRRLGGDNGAMSDPGFRLGINGGLQLPGGLPGAPGDDLASQAEFAAGLRPAGGNAGVQLRGTFRADPSTRPDDEAATISIGLNAQALGASAERGLGSTARLVADGAQLYEQAQSLHGELAGLVNSVQQSPEVARLQELGRTASSRQLTSEEMGEIASLTNAIGRQLRQASGMLARVPGLLDDAEGLIGRLGDGELSTRLGVTAAGYTEQTLGVRTPTLRAGQRGQHRFDAAVTGHLVQPLPLPGSAQQEMARLDESLAVRSMMISTRAYLDVTVGGLEALQSTLGEIRGALDDVQAAVGDAQDMLGEAQRNPLRTLANAQSLATEAEQTLQTLQQRGEQLATQVAGLEQEFRVDARMGVEVDHATARTGGGLQDVSVRYRFDPNESFQLAVQGYVQHLVGHLGGQRDRYSLDQESGELRHVSSEQLNVYRTFFPLIFGLDVGVSVNRDTNHRTDILAGFATDGDAVAVHMGLVQQLGRRFLLRMAVVDPDVTRRQDHILMPSLGADVLIGPRNDPGRASIGAQVGAAVMFGPGQSTELVGGQAGLGLQIRFGGPTGRR